MAFVYHWEENYSMHALLTNFCRQWKPGLSYAWDGTDLQGSKLYCLKNCNSTYPCILDTGLEESEIFSEVFQHCPVHNTNSQIPQRPNLAVSPFWAETHSALHGSDVGWGPDFANLSPMLESHQGTVVKVWTAWFKTNILGLSSNIPALKRKLKYLYIFN